MFDDDGSGGRWSTCCGYTSAQSMAEAEQTREQLGSLIPLGRTAKANDCAGLVEFLVMIIRRLFSTNRAIPITADEFRERRSKLVSLLSANLRANNASHLSNDYSPIAVLFSKRPTFAAREIPHNFRQCSYFRYLCGFDLPDKARLVITPKESILFRQV
ncbi:hypothetical protein DdX_01878 [Ditylenchus destructor]|uniref:Aminopeptidase P N-terminal domain-containing protein n=1 Tax=Ditylenchus destructor TaxID=166010 RepID=A0AAD4NGA1_9BILA|nr:hypothetical protein DdX_01878 [Ditylenchus destructor]